MTGRERIRAILHKQPRDRLAWTTLADDVTRSVMPQKFREMPLLEFYRAIGCDVMMFGNWGLPPGVEVVSPIRWSSPDETTWSHSGLVSECVRKSRRGTLTARFQRGHPTKYLVSTVADLHILIEICRNTRVEEIDSDEPEKSYGRAEDAIGDAGLYFETTGPSPVQQLIETDMGLETFYYFMADHPGEMRDLLATMHALRRQEYGILARRSRAECVIPVENTSSTLTSPAVYRAWSLPQISDYVRILHAGGKKVVLHMCGKLRDLLPELRETGLDGVNALTPPALGDCTFEHALDVLGEDTVILGGVLPGFQDPGATPGSIKATLDHLFTPRVRNSNLLLWAAADGLETPIERFLAVREWFEG